MAKQYETESNKMTKPIENTKTRRGFLKKAALGSAVITTVTSRPVWAGQCSMSGNLSNNMSNPNTQASCQIKGYSAHSWCDDNLLRLIRVSKHTPLHHLIPGAPRNAKVKDALPAQCSGGNLSHLGEDVMWQKKWRQLTTSELNKRLWQTMMTECDGNPYCNFLSNPNLISKDFYYPTDNWHYKYQNLGTLEEVNNRIDGRSRDYWDIDKYHRDKHNHNNQGWRGENDDDDDGDDDD